MRSALGMGYAAQVSPLVVLDDKRVQDGVGRVLLDLVLCDGLAIAGHRIIENTPSNDPLEQGDWLQRLAALWPEIGALFWLKDFSAFGGFCEAVLLSGSPGVLTGFSGPDASACWAPFAQSARAVHAESLDLSGLCAVVVPQFADAGPQAISVHAFRSLRARTEALGLPILLWRDLHGLIDDQDALRPLADGILYAPGDPVDPSSFALLVRKELAGRVQSLGEGAPPEGEALASLWALADPAAREGLLDAAYYLEAGLQNIAASIGVAVDVLRRGARIRLLPRPPKEGEVPADTERFCLRMAEEGVAVGPSEAPALCLSTAHGPEDLDFVLDSARNAWRA